jgi:hypothetical protein
MNLTILRNLINLIRKHIWIHDLFELLVICINRDVHECNVRVCPLFPLLVNPFLDTLRLCLRISLEFESIRIPRCSFFGVGPIVCDLNGNIEVPTETVFRLFRRLLGPDSVSGGNGRLGELLLDVLTFRRASWDFFKCFVRLDIVMALRESE